MRSFEFAILALLVNIEMATCRARGSMSSRSGDYGKSASMVYARQTRAVARNHLYIVLPFLARSVVGGMVSMLAPVDVRKGG